jgi:hypothetical protein
MFRPSPSAVVFVCCAQSVSKTFLVLRIPSFIRARVAQKSSRDVRIFVVKRNDFSYNFSQQGYRPTRSNKGEKMAKRKKAKTTKRKKIAKKKTRKSKKR